MRKASPTLTDAELRLMKVLWKRGPSTAHEVQEAVAGTPALAYSTVRTTLRILEKKGYVRHEKEGRAFIYTPLVDPGEARRSVLRWVKSRFFNDSASLLVLNLLESDEIGEEELAELRELIRARG